MLGNNKTLSGEIRVTLPNTLSQELFIEDFAIFAKTYPNINLEIIESCRSFNLINREADVAIRVSNSPLEYLIGTKLANVHRAVYISHIFEDKLHDEECLSQQNWIGWSQKMRQPIGKITENYPKFSSKHSIVSPSLQSKACKLGMGIAVLPCFIGDPYPQLVRVPPYISEKKYELWLLSHPDLRNNTKIQTFLKFIKNRLNNKAALIEGRCMT